MKEVDYEYIFFRHKNNILTLKKSFNNGMFTIRQANELGINHQDFCIMCADGVVGASWIPDGAFYLKKHFL